MAFTIFPRTCRESRSFRKTGDSPEEFRRNLRYGGLPAIHTLELTDEAIFPCLNALYRMIVLKPEQLDRIVRFLYNNTGNVGTAMRISDFLKNQKLTTSIDKVLHYLSCLENAFLVHRVRRYDIKRLRQPAIYD